MSEPESTISGPESMPGGWRLPRLRIDRNGDWYDDDVEITHPGILTNLRGNLRHDAEGYFIQTRVRIPVQVEDVPWVVVRVERRGDRLYGVVNDGSEDAIDPASLRIGPDEVPYCRVKNDQFTARLSRAATFQLLALAEPDPAGGEVLRLGDRVWPLPRAK